MTTLSAASDVGAPRRRARARPVVLVAVVLAGLLALAGCLMMKSCAPGALEVHVVDGDTPVEGAAVGLTGKLAVVGETYRIDPSGGGRTDSGGVVVFDGVDCGSCDLLVRHDDYVVHEERSLHVPGGERTTHMVSLRRGARVRGRVVDTAGAPLAGVGLRTFVLRRAAGGEAALDDLHVRATTDTEGAFLTSAVEPDAPLLIRLHVFRDGRAIVAQALVPSPVAGINDVGDVRVLDTETVLHLAGEPVRDDLRIEGSVAATARGGTPWTFEFDNWYFAPDGTAPVVGLPDGRLRWRLVEARLGPAPNRIVVGEGEADLTGPRREAEVRRTSPPR